MITEIYISVRRDINLKNLIFVFEKINIRFNLRGFELIMSIINTGKDFLAIALDFKFVFFAV